MQCIKCKVKVKSGKVKSYRFFIYMVYIIWSIDILAFIWHYCIIIRLNNTK